MRGTFFALVLLPAAVMAEDLNSLVVRCAPLVHPSTMASIISTESGGNPLAILDNGSSDVPRSQRIMRNYRPQTKEDAIRIARDLIAAGHIVDLGLVQINHRNLRKLGMSVDDAFDPCKNVAGGQNVLYDFYKEAAEQHGQGETALLSALSAYNTGNFRDGFQNGYVNKILSAAGRPVSALKVMPVKVRISKSARVVKLSYTGQEKVIGRITKEEAKVAGPAALGWNSSYALRN